MRSATTRIVENRGVGGDVLIPPSYPGVAGSSAANPRSTLQATLVTTSPTTARRRPDRLDRAGVAARGLLLRRMLRTIVYSVAAVLVESVCWGRDLGDRQGDRPSARLVSLRLVGVPSAALRRAQWIEALIPMTGGALLAIVLGQLIGVTPRVRRRSRPPDHDPVEADAGARRAAAVVGVIVAGSP